ncbi:MAG: aminoacetone oxidase family FAD-binding enzyme [Bacteroidales bacterium]|nr:aminoacetone oxidase family FAD-binding enzyme [Bacteroidales bacterium]
MKVAIVGGGAAGFFAAVSIKEMRRDIEVCILEKGERVLRKVEISGGGRCNCTNSFEHVSNLQDVYPRGHRLMKRLLGIFGQRETMEWFENHGVPLVTQDDDCVFPKSQDSHSITDCLMESARALDVNVLKGTKVDSLDDVMRRFDKVIFATGGGRSDEHYRLLSDAGIEIVKPVPSLYSLAINDESLNAMSGIVAQGVTISYTGEKIKAFGDLLLTHKGISGPAAMRLTSYAAREWAAAGFCHDIAINWTGTNEDRIREEISRAVKDQGAKMIANIRIEGLSARLWEHITRRSGIDGDKRMKDLGKKDINKLTECLTNDRYLVSGRAMSGDEIVTCGGVSLKEFDSKSLECKKIPGLFFAGEVTDVDGVTGGFNLQAAWSMARAAATAVASAT